MKVFQMRQLHYQARDSLDDCLKTDYFQGEQIYKLYC